MGLYRTAGEIRVESAIPFALQAYLAWDDDLVAFFGAEHIVVRSMSELTGLSVANGPTLCVVPRLWEKEIRLPSDTGQADYPIALVTFLPRETPALDGIVPPAKPTVASAGSGLRTGGYRYVITGGHDRGESFASELSDFVDLSSEKTSLSWATRSDLTWFRVWRTPADGLALRFLKALAGAELTAATAGGVVTFADDLPDTSLQAELAPIKLFAEDLRAHQRTVVTRREPFLWNGIQIADLAMSFREVSDQVRADVGNQRVIEVHAIVPLQYDVITHAPTAAGSTP